MGETPIIATRGLTKDFRSLRRRLRALDDVTLTVNSGEVFGLLGANGAGKTTLVKVLLGLARPTTGEALLRGLNPRRSTARLKVGYLPEGHRFPEYLPGREALRLFGRMAGVDSATLERRIGELLAQVELEDRGRDRIGRYSKGMTQRLGLAAALIDEPEILFLDEPTDGVDPVGRRKIRDILLEWKARGTTIFINSHLLSEVERTCDRVAILHRGRVVREGAVEELTRPTLRFRVRIEGTFDPAALPRLAGVDMAPRNGHIEVAVGDLTTLNRWLDGVRAQRHLLAEVAQMRSDLEDVFVQVVGDAENGTHPPVPGADSGGGA